MTDIPALAFPHKWETTDGTTIIAKGMTLRDYFAGRAMQALIRFEDKALPYASRNTKDFDDRVSYQAYRYADAMMKARTE